MSPPELPDLTADQTEEIRELGQRIPPENHLTDFWSEILELENDGRVADWLAGGSGKTCECGLDMQRWEALNGCCSSCAHAPDVQAHFSKDPVCPCGHPSRHGWHMSAADPRLVLGRCKAYWAAHEGIATDKKTGERVTYRFAVDPKDRNRLVRSEVERHARADEAWDYR